MATAKRFVFFLMFSQYYTTTTGAAPAVTGRCCFIGGSTTLTIQKVIMKIEDRIKLAIERKNKLIIDFKENVNDLLLIADKIKKCDLNSKTGIENLFKFRSELAINSLKGDELKRLIENKFKHIEKLKQ